MRSVACRHGLKPPTELRLRWQTGLSNSRRPGFRHAARPARHRGGRACAPWRARRWQSHAVSWAGAPPPRRLRRDRSALEAQGGLCARPRVSTWSAMRAVRCLCGRTYRVCALTLVVGCDNCNVRRRPPPSTPRPRPRPLSRQNARKHARRTRRPRARRGQPTAKNGRPGAGRVIGVGLLVFFAEIYFSYYYSLPPRAHATAQTRPSDHRRERTRTSSSAPRRAPLPSSARRVPSAITRPHADPRSCVCGVSRSLSAGRRRAPGAREKFTREITAAADSKRATGNTHLDTCAARAKIKIPTKRVPRVGNILSLLCSARASITTTRRVHQVRNPADRWVSTRMPMLSPATDVDAPRA